MTSGRGALLASALAALGGAVLLAACLRPAVARRSPEGARPEAAAAPAPEALGAGRGWLYRLGAEPVMGSGFNAAAVFAERDDARAAAALQGALAAARQLEKKISKYDRQSEVRRSWELRPGERLRVSEDTFRALTVSMELWRRSGGAFDCTVGPLLDLYKFTGREERVPTGQELAAARTRVGSDKLRLDAEKRTLGFSAPGLELDLGAVGQGFGADAACAALAAAGARSALVELGGEVRALGEKWPGQPWEIGIVHPREPGRLMATVQLSGNAASTSGDYEKYFKKGGRRASHILDPRTGEPLLGGAVSVTVIAPECGLADGLATAVSVLGPAEGLKLVESYRAEGRAVEALIIEETADGKLVPHFSPGLAGKLKVELDVSAAAPAK
jgi:thiamine biosynthesis lipoprotein